ncbi:MAG: hypothetical protein IKR94_04690 [Bacteroidales bacterium]|nr:hypothetical protein [Bacteroidales bacterium]MBR4214600.1 hypothetical protein [Bacteroidales bacterium]
MKIKHLPIAVAALMLSACGGANQNQNQNQNQTAGNNADTTTTQPVVQSESTNKVATPELSAAADDDSDIAMKFWDEFLKTYDPLGMLDGDELPDADMIASNRSQVKTISPEMAKFVAEGAEGFEETAVCYKYKNGGYMVLLYFDPKAGEGHQISLYTFKNGKITPFNDGYLMLPEYVEIKTEGHRHYLAKGYYIKKLKPDGFYVFGEGGDGYNTAWNGEKFYCPDYEDPDL